MTTVVPPARTEISDTYPLPSDGTARIGFGKLWDYVTNLLGTAGSPLTARTALGVGTTDSPVFTGLNGGQLAGMRNRMINGDCRIAQRGSIAVVNNAYTYGGCDRIAVAPTGFTTATGNIQQYTGQATKSSFAQGIALTSTGAGALAFQSRLEALNTRDLNSTQITISAWVFQNTGGSLNANIQLVKPSTTVDTFSAQTSLGTSANTSIPTGVLTKLSYTYTLGAAEASLGLAPTVNFPSVGAVTAKDFLVGDWQFEIGSVATTFEQHDIGYELHLCQRYYETPGKAVTSEIVCLQGTYGAGVNISTQLAFAVTKRANPSISFIGTWSVASVGQPYSSGSGPNGVCITALSTAANGQSTFSSIANSAYLTVNAEL